ncbi:MAG: hypothetical protein HN348_13025 [Proteobacteria bacterium]|jgi:hypothetical protein|nr:hypothetical protein [Pseudomonadota bacterium]
MEDLLNVSRAVTEGYKVWIALGGVLIALLWVRSNRRTLVQLLLGLTIVAGLNYARWGERALFVQVDSYDLIHYYLNAKYFDELGYYDLYPACMLADHENAGPYFDEGNKYMAQDEAGHSMQPIAHALSRGKVVRDTNFTEERWEEFEHDLIFFQRKTRDLNAKLWRQMIQDHGFNGTPTWVLFAEPIATVIPVEYVKMLGYIDLLLLAGAVVAVGWAYGGTTAMWTALFLLVSYSMRWPTVTWVFLRYDFLFGMILAMCLLKKRKPLWAGIFAGYTGVLRMFPVMWMWGPFAKGVSGLTRKMVHKRLLVFAGGFLIAVVAIEGVALVRYGVEPTVVHFENMMDHNKPEQLSSRRVGLALALPFRGATLPKFIEKERKAKVEKQKPLRYGLAFLYLLIVGWGMRHLRDDEAYGFGFIPFFLLTTASYYYYITRVTLAILHASDLSKLRNRVGLAMILGLEAFTNGAESMLPGHRVFLVGYLSWGLALYAIVMGTWFIVESLQKKADDTTE